jgi:YfiR/HmsC-like
MVHERPDNSTPPLPRRLAAFALCLLCVLTLSSRAAGEDIDAAKAAKVKAAYLLNFAKLTKWPESRFADDRAPIQIVVLDDREFAARLRSTVEDRRLGGRRLEVVDLAHTPAKEGKPGEERDAFVKSVKAAHLLYSANPDYEADSPQMLDLLSLTEAADVLTVGVGKHHTRAGGMISFVVEERKIIFEVNLTRVNESNLKLSSKLLSLARIVAPDKAPPR